MTRNLCFPAALAGLALASIGYSQSDPIAYTGAHIIPITGAEIADGVLVIQDLRPVYCKPTYSTAVQVSRLTVRPRHEGQLLTLPAIV